MSDTFSVQLQQILKRKAKEAGESLLDAMSSAQVLNLNQRLNQGIGIDDKPMPPLSPAYSKSKGKSRLRSLLDTGHMRRSIRIIKKPNLHTIGFGDSFAKDKATWNNKKYRWWGISKRDQQRLNQVLLETLRGQQR